MKIVFAGDELLQGLPGAGIVAGVAAGLRGHHFINEGRFGDTSLNLYRRVEDDLLAHRPQAAFLLSGLHDAISRSERGLRPYYRWRKDLRAGRSSPIACRENLRAILEQLERHGIRCLVALPPVEYRPELVNALRDVNGAARQLCDELQVPVLDLQTVMTPANVPARPSLQLPWLARSWLWQYRAPDYERLRQQGNFSYSLDGLRPTPAGAQRMATFIVDFLRQNGLPG